MSQDLHSLLGAEGIEKLRQLLLGEAVGRADVPNEANTSRVQPGVEVGPEATFFDATDSMSSMSWSDMVEEEEKGVVGVPPVSSVVKERVSFGGFGFGEQSVVETRTTPGVGGMSQYVKTTSAQDLRRQLQLIGIKMPKASLFLLAMCTYTGATMPAFFFSGKEKLKTLAVLGDAALVAALCANSLSVGAPVESMQSVKTTRLTDAEMSRAFARSTMARCISTGAGVELGHTKTGATALEAIVGLVSYYRSPSDVFKLAQFFGLF